MLFSFRQAARDALDLGRRPIELAGLRLSPSEVRICKDVTRGLKERRIVGLQAYARPLPKSQLKYSLPAFEQRKAWASRRMLLPRLGGTASGCLPMTSLEWSHRNGRSVTAPGLRPNCIAH